MAKKKAKRISYTPEQKQEFISQVTERMKNDGVSRNSACITIKEEQPDFPAPQTIDNWFSKMNKQLLPKPSPGRKPKTQKESVIPTEINDKTKPYIAFKAYETFMQTLARL